MSEYNFYQIDQVGVDQPDLDANTRTDGSVVIRRAADMKISNFGAGNVGSRMSSDYTRTVLTFQSKDELAEWNTITGFDQDANEFENPYVLGSTVKKVRDDQFFRMGMSNDRGAQIDAPKFDIMDTNLVDAAGMVAGKNWPSEGQRSFGGKYDFEPYTGGGIH